MIKFAFFLSQLIIVTFLPVNTLAQTGYSITAKLFEESDVILQGRILRRDLLPDNPATHEYMYTLAIDSVFKGQPRINQQYESDKIIDVSYFIRNCPYLLSLWGDKIPLIKDNCYEVGDSLILFLKDNFPKNETIQIGTDTIYPYYVIDQWAGILYPSSYLAIYLRRLSVSK